MGKPANTSRVDIEALLRAETRKLGQQQNSRELRAALQEIRRLREVLRAAYAVRTATVSVQPGKRLQLVGKRRATAIAVASDWHVEERVDPRKVQGLNRFNLRIAAFRAQRFFEAIVHMIETHNKSAFEIRNLVLCLNGDLITGWIHEELVATNYLSPPKAAAYVETLVSSGLRLLASKLPQVAVQVVCQPGNHGRTTPKRQIATYVDTSYEWLVYNHLAEKHPECVWQLGAGLHSTFSVYGLRVHLHHGDTVRYQGGIGGILVPLNKAALGWRAKYKADVSIVGHWHSLHMLPRLIVNGSLIGYGSYSDSLPLAEPEPPQQAFFLVDEKRGCCQWTNLWVSDPVEEKKI